jgi:amino acid adenylation domain-containing protein
MPHLWDLFARQLRERPDAVALDVPEGRFTCAQLGGAALAVSRSLRNSEEAFVGLCADRDLGTYAGLLGILHAGKGYVPLPPHLPADRLRHMADAAGLRTIVGGKGTAGLPPDLLHGRTVIGAGPATFTDAPATEGPYAYMLFTSGSTGVPKGVPIGHAQVLAYVAHMQEQLAATPGDGFTQLFELSFDLSVHDLFVCWASGGTLLVPGREQLMAPARYVQEKQARHWFSTPSTALLLERLRLLKPGAFPTLHTACFCGEPLPLRLAEAFQGATPNARLFNLYGPTETTIAIMGYRLPREAPKDRRGIVSIGRPFPAANARVTDEGELLIGGPQLAEGYWRDAERTATSFITDTDGVPRYRTGDRVEHDADGDLYFVERLDDQVKVRGHRVELQEVAHVLREASGAAFVEVLPHPVSEGMALGLHAFLPLDQEAAAARLRDACARALPEAVRPALHFIEALPLNASGKADRAALRALLGS